MEHTACSYEGCRNNAAANPSALCKSHRRLELGSGLRPLRPRSRIQSPTCTGPECSRRSESHDLCKQHAEQLHKTGRLHVIGDSTYRAQRSRERWASRTDEERAAWVAAMQAGRPRQRTLEQARNHASAASAAWKVKYAAADPLTRACLACTTPFTVKPTPGARAFYCSVECRRLYSALRRYKLTYQRYVEMLDQQGGLCAICKGPWAGWNTRNGNPHVDHCHTTGRVRGLLCGSCNTALGRFGDDPALLRRAADYLEA